MPFDPKAYGPSVAEILALDGDGERLMPLVADGCSSADAAGRLRGATAKDLFKHARGPKSALSGLWLYFSCFEEAHEIAQERKSAEGKYWHAIVHRQEPDAGNSAYWFRQLGKHPIFPEVAKAASEIVARIPEAEFRSSATRWDPFAFVLFCERARSQPGSPSEQAAREIHRAEWQALFDYCARPKA